MQIYNRAFPSVRQSVGRSVGIFPFCNSFFLISTIIKTIKWIERGLKFQKLCKLVWVKLITGSRNVSYGPNLDNNSIMEMLVIIDIQDVWSDISAMK